MDLSSIDVSAHVRSIRGGFILAVAMAATAIVMGLVSDPSGPMLVMFSLASFLASLVLFLMARAALRELDHWDV